MKKIALRLLTTLMLILTGANASALTVIQGKVLNEQAQPLKKATITINQQQTMTDNNGDFQLSLATDDIYQLAIEKPEHYSSIQTFSHYELSQHQFRIADITLVKQQADRVMLAFAGDAMMGRRYYQPYFGDPVLITPENRLADSKNIVRHMKPYLSLADYAAVNLETQIAEHKPSQRAKKSVTFYSHPDTLAALSWAGVDYVSLGNNHTYDYLEQGLATTLQALAASDLDYSGAGVDQQNALAAHHQQLNSTSLAMLGYVGWTGSAKPSQTATAEHGGAAYGSMANILASVKQQVAKNYVTIVQYHGSQEYADEPTSATEQRLKSALDAGAELAIAHHPHVTQGLELYNNKLLAYSLGNFIFDQNFTATHHSYLLYVWLDAGKFHRAEMVPLYVKGYQPTPATGMHRYNTMKRLTELSKRRATLVTQSGGHGVISRQSKQPLLQPNQPLIFKQSEKVVSLYQLPWHSSIKQVLSHEPDLQYRLGLNLINGSDFESFDYFTSPERSWVFDRTNTQLNNFGASGQRSLALTVDNHATLGMQSFRRVYQASSPMTIKAKLQTDNAVRISFYWQGRKTRQKLFDAFEQGEKHKIAELDLTASKAWQNIEVDFNSPRIGYRSFRVLAEITTADGKRSVVNVDDFALIEWQTAFRSPQQPVLHTRLSRQAAYIGFNKVVTQPIQVKF